jgi:hypothetical protein
MTLFSINNKIKKELSQDHVFEFLDDISGFPYITWCEGGCLILALAINHMFPDSKKLLIWRNKIPDHVVVELSNKWLVDGHGFHRRTDIFKYWKQFTGLNASYDLTEYDDKYCKRDFIYPRCSIQTICDFFIKNKISFENYKNMIDKL